MDKLLIANTTREERERIVLESLGYSGIGCEGSVDGYDMYLPYIEGKMELRDITMNYRASYVKDMEPEPPKRSCVKF